MSMSLVLSSPYAVDNPRRRSWQLTGPSPGSAEVSLMLQAV